MKYILTSEGRLLPTANGFEREYFLTDHLGNTRLVFKKSGDSALIIQENHYYAYGMEIADQSFSSTAVPNNFLYNGKEYDANTGYYQYGFRQYYAQIGRWWVVDALAEDYFSESPYNYCLNNPVNFIDPFGLSAQSLSDIINQLWNSPYGGSWSSGGGYLYYWSSDNARNEGTIALIESGWSGSGSAGGTYLLPGVTVTGSAYNFLMGKNDAFFWDEPSRKYAAAVMWSTWYIEGIQAGIDGRKDGALDFIRGMATPLALQLFGMGKEALDGNFDPLLGFLNPGYGIASQIRAYANGDGYAKARIGTNLGFTGGAVVLSAGLVKGSFRTQTIQQNTNVPLSGKIIGLGIDSDLASHRGSGAIIYKNAGWQQNGLTKVDWGRASMDNSHFRGSFREAAQNADAIRFNVSNFNPTKHPMTNFEFNHIINNPLLLQKTTFIKNGRIVVWNGTCFN